MPSRTFESFIEASGAWNEAQRLAVASQRLDDEQYDDEHAARTRTLAATLTARLAAAEPNLMTDGHLAALESTTAKLVKAVEEYIEPPVTADASEQAISTQLDELVGLVATLPTPEVTDPDAAAITLRNHVAKSAADLDALKAEIDAARSEAVALVSSLGQAMSRRSMGR